MKKPHTALTPDLPNEEFVDIIHRLRIWMARSQIPDMDKLRVEFHFPSERAQFAAECALKETLGRDMAWSYAISPLDFTRFKVEGISIGFTNPTKWDKRP